MPTLTASGVAPAITSGVGTASYNGVTFPNQISAKGSSRPVLDTAGRSTKYVEHTLTIEFVIADGTYDDGSSTTIDGNYQDIRRLLTQAGGVLRFEGKGFGDVFRINTYQQDVAFGPKPTMLSWEPIGSNKAIRVVWEVMVQIAECQGGEDLSSSYYRGKLAEINFSMNWDINESGLTTRTISGLIELPMNRSANSRVITDTVDRFRNNIKVPVPLAFKRVNQSWNVSEDKRTLIFSIVDSEIPSDNPYFPGTINVSAPYRISNQGLDFAKWDVSLSAIIEVAMGAPKWLAWAAFIIIADNRRKKLRNAKMINGRQQVIPGTMNTKSLAIEEDPYSRTLSFHLNWDLMCSLTYLFAGSGFLEDVPGTTWQAFRTSMTALTGDWSSRGHAGMKHLPSDDVIINICGGPQATQINEQMRRGRHGRSDVNLFQSKCPPPQSSWLTWKNEIEILQDQQTVVHQPLQNPEQLYQRNPNPNETTSVYGGGTLQPPIVQRRNQSRFRVRMRGYAMRACYPIPPIVLKKYGGVDVIPIGEQRQSTKRKHDFDLAVFVSHWDKLYELKGKPRGLNTPEELVTFEPGNLPGSGPFGGA